MDTLGTLKCGQVSSFEFSLMNPAGNAASPGEGFMQVGKN